MGDVENNVIGLTEKRGRLQAKKSTVWTRKQQAICVRRAYKKYGRENVILDGLNMTVPKGCIYGLLGASGCGKTTLLSCIVGRRRLNSGEIWVLGGKPGSAGSGVPGPRVGYMPQEIALNKEFTVRESMYYFGWINDMSTKEIDEKIKFLVSFLQLPSADRQVENLSGGQQRRVSLACALVHEPELLILDEPTVGVDPVLRQSIWDHLVNITKDGGTTVIITTHYIDETRQAHLIGMMRGGKLLAEESPENLLQKYDSDSLEGVFLKLSVLQNRGRRRRSSIAHDVTASITVPGIPLDGRINPTFDTSSEISGEFGETVGPTSISKRRSICTDPIPQFLDFPPEEKITLPLRDRLRMFKRSHMKALIWKNILWMWRNVAVMLFIIGLPVFQIILFCLSIGKDPVGLHLAIVNHEITDRTDCDDISYSCDPYLLSCRYLNFLRDKNQTLDFFDDEEAAKNAVQRGKAWAVIMFSSNYSESINLRLNNLTSLRELDGSAIDSGAINIWLDQSNQQISQLLQRDLLYSYRDFATSVMNSCNNSVQSSDIPVRFETPIYGSFNPVFTDFAAPGVILTIIFFLAVALTSGTMLIERNEGTLERCLVSGVTGIEVLLGHVTTQFLIMAFQSIMVIIFAVGVFKITVEGHLAYVAILTILTGLCGMTYGFVVSCVTDSERNATYLAMGSFLPMVMLCGVIWPVEGMNRVLRMISFFLPLTLSTESLRSILARGWTISEKTVYAGFISTVTWIIIFLTLSVLLIKFKKG